MSTSGALYFKLFSPIAKETIGDHANDFKDFEAIFYRLVESLREGVLVSFTVERGGGQDNAVEDVSLRITSIARRRGLLESRGRTADGRAIYIVSVIGKTFILKVAPRVTAV